MAFENLKIFWITRTKKRDTLRNVSLSLSLSANIVPNLPITGNSKRLSRPELQKKECPMKELYWLFYELQK